MSEPSRAVIEAVERAMRERLNISGPMRHIFGDEVGEAVKVLLAQEVQAAAPEVARAAEAAALRADAELVERMAEAMWRTEEKPTADYAGAIDGPEGWQELAHAALLALRETHDVTPRAEQ